MEKKYFWRFAFDLLCLIVFCVPLLLFNSDTIPVHQQGFFCDDLGIRYPFLNGQIPSWALFVEGVIAVVVISCVIEQYVVCSRKIIGSGPSQFSRSTQFVFEVYRVIGYLMIGACANQFLTDVGKHTVGRLRPHFYDLCQPSVACTEANSHQYITDFNCTRTSHPDIPQHKFEDRLLDARKSFPSGHSSFALYCAVYLVLYMEYRLSSFRQLRLTRHLVQATAVAWSLWVCGTRIVDFKHRFSDVCAGMAIGTSTALATFWVYRTSMRLSKRSERMERNALPMTDVQQPQS